MVVTKRRISAFTSSDLEVLCSGGVYSLVLASQTSGAALPTLRLTTDWITGRSGADDN